jgi:hypothetical protein
MTTRSTESVDEDPTERRGTGPGTPARPSPEKAARPGGHGSPEEQAGQPPRIVEPGRDPGSPRRSGVPPA